MKKQPILTKESFDRLLEWLDKDREKAATKYEEIRLRLIRIFAWRGVSCAEELADETINRVIGKVQIVSPTYSGDPALYFYGVAQNLSHEYFKGKPGPYAPPAPASDEQKEADHVCLESCLERLDPEARWLIVEYYQEGKQEKIKHRKALADRLGVTPHTLRMRTHRIKAGLKKCIIRCRNEAKGK